MTVLCDFAPRAYAIKIIRVNVLLNMKVLMIVNLHYFNAKQKSSLYSGKICALPLNCKQY